MLCFQRPARLRGNYYFDAIDGRHLLHETRNYIWVVDYREESTSPPKL